MNIYSKLLAVQSALKAPKSQYNKFGGYSYRKAEDILEAVKPLLAEQGCILTCSDELTLIGQRYYVKATATFTDCETGQSVICNAFAREEEDKKGMDGSQITGASSSYARKYALNGLLCIDDTQDSDTTNTGDTDPKPAPRKQAAKKAEAAPKAEAPKPEAKKQAPNPLDRETYFNFVKAYAEGKTTKSGGDLRQRWIEMANATPEMVAEFDEQVAEYKRAINGQEL